MPGCTVFRLLVRASLVVAATMAVACKEATDPVPIASLSPLPERDSVVVGRTLTLEVRAFDADGRPLDRRIDYVSSAPTIATVTEAGVITGVSVGEAIINASGGSKSVQMRLIVQQPVNSVIVTPTSFALSVGVTRQLTVTTNAASGQPLPGRRVTYLSSNPTIATVTADGLVAAVSLGRATITATSEEKTGTATVDVVPVQVASVSITPPGAQTVPQGSTLQLQATTRDGNGVILTGRTVTWSTANASIATVSNAGVVTGVALGSTQITAESEGRTASVQVTVAPRTIATISLIPNPGTVAVGAQLQLTVDIRDANGTPLTLDGRSVSWTSSNQPVATVTASGVVAGIAVGSATITVTVDGRQAVSLVNVTPPPGP